MVQNQLGVRYRTGQLGEIRILVVIVPGVIAMAESAQQGDAQAKLGIVIEAGGRAAGDHQGGFIVRRPGMANAPKESAAALDVGR